MGSEQIERNRAAFRKILWSGLFFLFAGTVAYDYTLIRFTTNQQYFRARLLDLLNNTAAVPFQYRILVGGLVNLLSRLKLSFFPFDAPIHLFQLMEFLATLFLLIAYRHYLGLFFKDRRLNTLLSFTLVLILPFNFLLTRTRAYYYPWDTPSLFFITLGLILLYKQRMLIYYPVFILATLNRETSGFLALIYVLVSLGKRKYATIFIHGALQLGLWVMIKYLLYRIYLHNPGVGLFQHHFSGNLEYLSHPGNYAILASSMGFLWIPTLLLYKKVRDDFARRALFAALPFFLLVMYAAKIGELRHYGELIPIILTGFLLIVRELFEPEFGPKAPSRSV